MDTTTANKLEYILSGYNVSMDDRDAIIDLMDKYASQFQQEWIPVVAVQDDSGHWYVIPKERYQTFRKDLNDEYFVDSGKFGDTYGQYLTGGDLNLTQLYIPNPTKS